jgi:hypothetical protein
MERVPLKGYIELKRASDRLEFDEVGYVRAYLMRNNRARHESQFRSKLKERRTSAPAADLHSVRGHTATELLSFYVAPKMNVPGNVAFALCETLLCSADAGCLLGFPLFALLTAATHSRMARHTRTAGYIVVGQPASRARCRASARTTRHVGAPTLTLAASSTTAPRSASSSPDAPNAQPQTSATSRRT